MRLAPFRSRMRGREGGYYFLKSETGQGSNYGNRKIFVALRAGRRSGSESGVSPRLIREPLYFP